MAAFQSLFGLTSQYGPATCHALYVLSQPDRSNARYVSYALRSTPSGSDAPQEVTEMNMPGYAAAASLYVSIHSYATSAVAMARNGSVRPQYVRPPWTQCSWLLFCCTEFHNSSCCKEWHLECVPE